MNKIQINNFESMDYKENNKPPKHSAFKLNEEYDGENVKIHIDTDLNGKKKHSLFKFSKDELLDMLGAHANYTPIDQRLVKDFSMKTIKNIRKNKNIRKKVRKSRKIK
jgi:hypothetical protein